eukprot:6205185-Pleurochrysis_carterae.AAC.9
MQPWPFSQFLAVNLCCTVTCGKVSSSLSLGRTISETRNLGCDALFSNLRLGFQCCLACLPPALLQLPTTAPLRRPHARTRLQRQLVPPPPTPPRRRIQIATFMERSSYIHK